jgi:hypothetical protein
LLTYEGESAMPSALTFSNLGPDDASRMDAAIELLEKIVEFKKVGSAAIEKLAKKRKREEAAKKLEELKAAQEAAAKELKTFDEEEEDDE